MNKQDIINFYLDNEVLLSPDILVELETKPLPLRTSFTVLNKDILNIIEKHQSIVVDDFEKSIVLKERHKNTKLYNKFIEYLNSSDVKQEHERSEFLDKLISSKPSNLNKGSEDATGTPENSSEKNIKFLLDIHQAKTQFLEEHRIKIISSYTTKARKWSVQDFVSLYASRFRELEKILRSRSELQSLTSIQRITQKKERENVSIIGVVYEKNLTKTGNMMLTIEDPTGTVKVVVNKNKEELFKLAEEIQLDEVIGLNGLFDQIVFVNTLFIPDIPLTKELKKSPEEGYFVVISDTEPGSKLFLEKEFNKFLSWISGEIGSDKQRDVASKIKYLFIVGDLVAGVGIYPNQEFDLNIIDIYDQYKALASLLKKIPEHIPIILCPGNHDVGRISEPQPPLPPEYAQELLNLPNVISLSNPAMINIYANPEQGFDGFDTMLYHGLSFVYYSEHIPSIRRSGGQKRPDLIMKYLLQRRHLAPAHTSTLYIPDPKKDPLVIDKVPDFLLSGHVHRAMVSNYKNVTCINASCWTSQSDEQERRGLEAQPARAFIVNMKTREVMIMNFLSKEDQEKEGQAKEEPAKVSLPQVNSPSVDLAAAGSAGRTASEADSTDIKLKINP
jgi:DNA polymerase II small subunit